MELAYANALLMRAGYAVTGRPNGRRLGEEKCGRGGATKCRLPQVAAV